MNTLWHGRFEEGPSDELLAFTVSLPFDRRLAVDDIAGSRAHVSGLVRARILSPREADAIGTALDQIEEELAKGTFEFVPSDEDIHTAVERRTIELAGPAGGKLHTGRSRNDQVATDLRLYTRRSLTAVAQQLHGVREALADLATDAGDTYLPGYTHLQQAQPVLLAHHLLAHGWAFGRDVDRLLATRARADVCPLGAGALAGSSLPLDPEFTAEVLGFASAFENSLDAVADRDFVAEALFDLALIGVHLSRIGEEVVLWSTEEFGFLKLHDAYSTGSSMLPQKKNPDIAELARGKAGRLIGDLTGLLVTLKGLPLAYNRDLQEDKEPLFDAVDQVRLALSAIQGLLTTAVFDVHRMQAAADAPHAAATDLAEHLVAAGMPFRDAHVVVGGLVRDAIQRRVPLPDLVRGAPRSRRGGRCPARAGSGGGPAHDARRGRAGRRRRPAGSLPGGSGRGPAAHLRAIRGSGGGTPSSDPRRAR